MSGLRRPFIYDRDIFVTLAYVAAILAIPQGAFAWGREGHQIIVIVAEHYMRPETVAHMRVLLAPRPNAVRPYTRPRIPSPEPLAPADPVIELQLEKAGVRLAYLLDANLILNAAGQ